MNIHKFGLLILFPALLFGFAGHATSDESLFDEFEPNEEIQSLELRFAAGPGVEINEPVALDLGVGFPFWLEPAGRQGSESARFGAVPTYTNALSTSLEPGITGSFIFDDRLDSRDGFRKTLQLLQGLRVSDIARIGFCARGQSDWMLQGYELRINGKLFFKNDEANARVQDVQAIAQMRLNQLNVDIQPLIEQAEPLRSIAQAGLASEEEVQQLVDIEEVLVPMLREQDRTRRQLEGSYPWYADTNFQSQWRGGDNVQELKVTLTTAAHVGADTLNYVYYQTGGRKYLLSSPVNPLTPRYGPQVFRLDINAGPLTTADIRGHALGMLGYDAPNGVAPDRWHPEHLMVEVDGRVIYDSEENEVDRMSLQAIRVIPPVHRDAMGELKTNVPNNREAFVWIAGQAMGLDMVHGGSLDLPLEDSVEYPIAETSFEEPADSVVIEGDVIIAGDDVFVSSDPDFPPFPGEEPLPPDWLPIDPSWDPACGCVWECVTCWVPDPVFPPPWEPVPGWDHVMDDYFDNIFPPEDWIPVPIGEPIQVHDIRLEVHDNFFPINLEWELAGNPGEVSHFIVSLLPVRLDRPQLLIGPPLASATVGASEREYTFPDVDRNPLPENEPYLFIVPLVVAVPHAGSPELAHAQFGAARTWVPSSYHFTRRNFDLGSFWRYGDDPGPMPRHSDIAQIWDGFPPSIPERAKMFRIGQTLVHDGILVDDNSPANNFVVFPGPTTTMMDIDFPPHQYLVFPAEPQRIVAHLGFLEGLSPGTQVRYRLTGAYHREVGGVNEKVSAAWNDWVEINSSADMNESPLVVVSKRMEPEAGDKISARIQIEFDSADPNHPPVIISPRVVKEPLP